MLYPITDPPSAPRPLQPILAFGILLLCALTAAAGCKTDLPKTTSDEQPTAYSEAHSPQPDAAGQPGAASKPGAEQTVDARALEPCDEQKLVDVYVRQFREQGHFLGMRVDNSARLREDDCETMRTRLIDEYDDLKRSFCKRYGLVPVDDTARILEQALSGTTRMFEPLQKTAAGHYRRRPQTPCQETEKSCKESRDCQVAGKCTASPTDDPRWGRINRCQVDNEGCERSDRCRDKGACTADLGRCIAADDSDCRESRACTNNGRCVAEDGECKGTTDEHCRAAKRCRERGACSADEKGGSCVVSSHADCEDSRRCAEEGQCTAIVAEYYPPASGPRCATEFDADCAKSRACKEEGRCKRAPDGRCVEDSPYIDGRGYPLSHTCEDLQKRERRAACRTDKDGVEKCGADFIVCHATDAYCETQPECEESADCAARAGYLEGRPCSDDSRTLKSCPPRVKICGPTNQTCADSELCRKEGRCRAQALLARHYHQTVFPGGDANCAPGSDAHCEASEACAEEGKCGHVQVGNPYFDFCAPTTEAHCRQSKTCREDGNCALQRRNIDAICGPER